MSDDAHGGGGGPQVADFITLNGLRICNIVIVAKDVYFISVYLDVHMRYTIQAILSRLFDLIEHKKIFMNISYSFILNY